MKKFFLIVIILLTSLTGIAQEVELDGNFFSRRYNKITYDTTYIMRPKCKWTFKLRTMTIWQTFYAEEGEAMDAELGQTTFKTDLYTNFKPKLNVQVGYMGIALAGGISFNKLAGQKDRDFDIKLNMYGKTFGFELGLSGIQTLHGNYIIDVPGMDIFPYPVVTDDNDSLYLPLPIELEVPEGKVNQIVFNFNFYYAFNHRKFSYPAAFTQMFLQKRSAGSLLAGGEMHFNNISIGDTINSDELFRLTNITFGLGVGYGYNFVLPHNWLIHISALPYIVLYSKTRVRNYMEEEYSVKSDFPEIFLVGRTAIIHDFNYKWFIGATGQVNWSNINTRTLQTGNSQFQVFLFVGIRI